MINIIADLTRLSAPWIKSAIIYCSGLKYNFDLINLNLRLPYLSGDCIGSLLLFHLQLFNVFTFFALSE